MKKIGICGGTFDPIHLGHLAIAELVRSQVGLDEVLFIPSGMPPHKDLKIVTDPIDRINMVKIATESNPFFEAISMEVEREGLTFTVDTLAELHKKYGKNTKFYYIIGADVVMDLLTWRNVELVLELTEFISVMRPGYSQSEYFEQLDMLKKTYSARITSIEIPLIEISSTFIRKRIEENKSIKYLVPQEVEHYIYMHKLYI